jgi:hypothetical protein
MGEAAVGEEKNREKTEKIKTRRNNCVTRREDKMWKTKNTKTT